MQKVRLLQRDDSRIIIHFDYDCFYASVVENENPALKAVPLAIQQKQIVVTCNYEARRRGLRKLQLITEAKRICPEAVIVLGEDLTRFRNASKELYGFLTQATWNDQAERLGFDEVWLDCTDMIDYNFELLNPNDLQHSFFCLDKDDPTCGFEYDASIIFGPQYPPAIDQNAMFDGRLDEADLRLEQHLLQRLMLGSHFARHLRHELEHQKGYTATVGISTNKVLSKLVGNLNKPKNQSTLIPPYNPSSNGEGTPVHFMDSHDIGRVPGIGFKLAQKIRAHVLGRTAAFDSGLVYGGTKENITVRDVRLFPEMGPRVLEEILEGPGSQRGIGGKIWGLLHGVDDSKVSKMKRVPSQISQEDSYMKYLHTFEQVRQQLFLLAERLLRRMHLDLLEHDQLDEGSGRKWLAHPRTVRLSTRPRPPTCDDGTRTRTFHRISRSAPMPSFAFSLTESSAILAEKLVEETLVPMFRKLHPQRSGWNLSLINIAVVNMAETATDSKDGNGRDIGHMFRRQDEVLKEFRITELEPDLERDLAVSPNEVIQAEFKDEPSGQTVDDGDAWDSDEAEAELEVCPHCQARVPVFARDAHRRYHMLTD